MEPLCPDSFIVGDARDEVRMAVAFGLLDEGGL